MPNRIKEALDRRYQPRMAQLGARVTSRPVDANGRGLGYVIATVGGQVGVRVWTGSDAVYYPGDNLLVEQRGSAAAATYVALGWQGGVRPAGGVIEITEAATIGGVAYNPGDVIIGRPAADDRLVVDRDGALQMITGEGDVHLDGDGITLVRDGPGGYVKWIDSTWTTDVGEIYSSQAEVQNVLTMRAMGGTDNLMRLIADAVQLNADVGVGNIEPACALDVDGGRMRLRTSSPPASASDTGLAGEMAWEEKSGTGYLYLCIAADTWVRVALATWS